MKGQHTPETFHNDFKTSEALHSHTAWLRHVTTEFCMLPCATERPVTTLRHQRKEEDRQTQKIDQSHAFPMCQARLAHVPKLQAEAPECCTSWTRSLYCNSGLYIVEVPLSWHALCAHLVLLG